MIPFIIQPIHPLARLWKYVLCLTSCHLKSKIKAMLQNYFKIAFRNLLKNKLYVFINIAGLTVGMTCFILIALYIQYEMSYDSHHEKADQIYRVVQQQKGNNFRGIDMFNTAPMPLAPTLKEEFPEIEAATTLQFQRTLFHHKKEVFSEVGMVADEFVYDVFTFPVIEGIGAEALLDPDAIVLTQSMAKKYFGDASPIGQTLLYENKKELMVKGVIEDAPKNQHFQFDYITSYKNYDEYPNDIGRWVSNNYKAYIVLPKGYDYKEFEQKMTILDNYTKPAFEALSWDFSPRFFLQPLKDIHLYSNVNFDTDGTGDIRYMYLLGSIAFIILFLASINYMNLATVQSASRSLEVGMRKVLGARKKQLILQLLTESALLTIISFLLAIQLVNILLPAFNQLLDQFIPYSFLGNGLLLIGMLSIAILVGILSGLYPAIVLSAISPVKAFRGNFLKSYKRGATLRNTLVVGQFATAIILAICSMVIYQQLQYIQNKKLGYNREQIVYLPFRNETVYKKANTVRSELLKHPQINKVSIARVLPLNTNNQGIVNEWEGNDNQEELWIYRNFVDYNYFDLFEMELVEGRNFSPEHPTDSSGAYILNESAVKAIGWESAVGKAFRGGRVVGVVKDFHFQPFDLRIEPMFITYREWAYGHYGNIAIKIGMEELDKTLAYIQQTMKTLVPQYPFQHRFMDESYNQLYQSEQRFGQAFNIFTLLALFIACMGLFGLASYNVLQRTKEIGIRKVLGATVTQIVQLLSKDFLKLVGISLLLATPIAWYIMHQWLENFAYRINLQLWVFVLAGILSVAIAFLTVSFQSIRAALANPVDVLHKE